MKKPRKTISKTVNMLATIVAGSCLVASIVLMSGATGRRAAAAGREKTFANVVSIDNFSFTPMELTVSPGTQVTWTNKDDVPHTVSSVDRKFKSEALDTDEKFSFTFKDPGTYEYFCSVHPKMTGKIIVE